MTFRKWVEIFAPHKIVDDKPGSVVGCPMDRDLWSCTTMDCDECWSRQMPDAVTATIYDTEEVIENCTVTIWSNSVTGDMSIGWQRNETD